MAEVRWTGKALDHLEAIRDYLFQKNEYIADRIVEEIFEEVKILKMFPLIGYLYETTSNDHIRILMYGHYKIAYLVVNENKIDIVGIYHSLMDISKYLP